MRSDPNIVVTCDKCLVAEIEVGLTALARRSYDERNVDGTIRRAGWQVIDGEDVCEDCYDHPNG